MFSWASKLDYTIIDGSSPRVVKIVRTVPSRDSLIDDVQLQNKQLADLCKQAEALRHAARLLCDYLTERIQHSRALLQFQGSSDRRKKPRINARAPGAGRAGLSGTARATARSG
jgi:hypothetical protein